MLHFKLGLHCVVHHSPCLVAESPTCPQCDGRQTLIKVVSSRPQQSIEFLEVCFSKLPMSGLYHPWYTYPKK